MQISDFKEAEIIKLFNEALFRDTIQKKENGEFELASQNYKLTCSKDIVEAVASEIEATLASNMKRLIGAVDEGQEGISHIIAEVISEMQGATADCFDGLEINRTTDMVIEYLKQERDSSKELYEELFRGLTIYYKSIKSLIEEDYGEDEKEKDIRTNAYKKYINKMLKEGLFKPEYLQGLGYFDELEETEIAELYKNGILSQMEMIVICQLGSFSEEALFKMIAGTRLEKNPNADPYELVARKYKDLQRRKSKRVKEYEGLFSTRRACQMYSKGIFDMDDLKEYDISKDFVHLLDEETFLGMAKYGFPNGISFTSEELVNNYLDRYSGHTLIELSKLGYVEPEELLWLTQIDLGDFYDEKLKIKENELFEFYTPEKIANLFSDGKIDFNFLKLFDIIILQKQGGDIQNKFFEQFMTILERESSNTENFSKIIAMYEEGIIPQEVMQKSGISYNTIEALYLSDEIDIEKIVKLFNSGILDIKVLNNILGQDEIINMVGEGSLNENALFVIPTRDLENVLKQSIENGAISVKELLGFYIDCDGISIEQFNDIYRNSGQLDDILPLLPDSITKLKIKELYINYLISHSNLAELKSRGTISQEDFEEIAQSLSDAEFYKIFDTEENIYSIREQEEITTRTNSVSDRGDGKSSEEEEETKISKKARIEFFKNLGAMDKVIQIQELEQEEKNAPFKGYSIVGFPEYGLIVLENFEHRNNATYIMAHQQFSYYINNSEKTRMIFEGSKQGLRQSSKLGEAVRVKPHTKNWGSLVIDSFIELSIRANDRLKPEGELSKEAEEMARNITEDYER